MMEIMNANNMVVLKLGARELNIHISIEKEIVMV